MAKTRIYIDSVLDKDTVRVLISTDGKKETPVILEMKALERLLKKRKDLWKTFEVRRKGEIETRVVLRRDIEGEALTFDESETPFFEKLVKDHGGPFRLTERGEVKRVKPDRITRRFKKPSRARGGLRKKIETRKKALRKARRRVDR